VLKNSNRNKTLAKKLAQPFLLCFLFCLSQLFKLVFHAFLGKIMLKQDLLHALLIKLRELNADIANFRFLEKCKDFLPIKPVFLLLELFLYSIEDCCGIALFSYKL